jgi:hypothetical protein
LNKTSEKRKRQTDASSARSGTKDEDYEASYQQVFLEGIVPKLRTLSDLKGDAI